MFNLLKLLSGISSSSDKEKTAQSPQNDGANPVNTTPPPTPPPTDAIHRNVMADVIERHERISYRVKK